jgi:hypothetical protein
LLAYLLAASPHKHCRCAHPLLCPAPVPPPPLRPFPCPAARRARGSSPSCPSCRPPLSSACQTRRRRQAARLPACCLWLPAGRSLAAAACMLHAVAACMLHAVAAAAAGYPCCLGVFPRSTPAPACLPSVLPPTARSTPGPNTTGSHHSHALPLLPACLQVRQRAARNLGDLARMSMRADQLVTGRWATSHTPRCPLACLPASFCLFLMALFVPCLPLQLPRFGWAEALTACLPARLPAC